MITERRETAWWLLCWSLSFGLSPSSSLTSYWVVSVATCNVWPSLPQSRKLRPVVIQSRQYIELTLGAALCWIPWIHECNQRVHAHSLFVGKSWSFISKTPATEGNARVGLWINAPKNAQPHFLRRCTKGNCADKTQALEKTLESKGTCRMQCHPTSCAGFDPGVQSIFWHTPAHSRCYGHQTSLALSLDSLEERGAYESFESAGASSCQHF